MNNNQNPWDLLEKIKQDIQVRFENEEIFEKGKFKAQVAIDGTRELLKAFPEEIQEDFEEFVSEFWEMLEVEDDEPEDLPERMRSLALGLQAGMKPLEEEIAELEEQLTEKKAALFKLKDAYNSVIGRKTEELNSDDHLKNARRVDYEGGIERLMTGLRSNTLFPKEGGWTRAEVATAIGIEHWNGSHISALLRKAIEMELLEHNGSAGRGARYLIPE